MSEDRQHHAALFYTIIFFGLVAGLSYWQLFRLDQNAPTAAEPATTEIQIDLSELF